MQRFADDTDNEVLKEIVLNLNGYCDALEISNIMECITLVIDFIEKR